MFGKLTALVCAGLMLVSTAVGAQEQENRLKKEVELLEALEIYQPPGYSEESYQEPVTRAEFISAIMHMAYKDTLEGEVKGANFSDVEEDNFYYKDILAAKNMSLISGMAYDRFMPDETIKTAHAIGILKRVLGYEKADDSMVMMKGLADGVDTVSEDMTVGNLIKLLYNALEIDKMCYVSEGEWRIVKDETILKADLEVDTLRGIVTANQYTSLYSANGTGRENVISIDSVDFDCGEYNLDEYLGCEIEVYYRDTYDSDRPEIVYVDKVSMDNVIFEADDIISYKKNSYTVRIPDENRNKNYRVEADAAIIYNEVAIKTLSYMKPLYGEVELIDNDSDGGYDVVKINSYDTHFADGIYVKDYIVYSNGSELKFDEYTFVTVDGEESQFSAIVPQSVILVRESANTSGERFRHIEVCTTKIEGRAESVDMDEAVINGTEYKLNTTLGADVSVDKEGVFYLDSRGRIAYFTVKIISSERYGLLLRAVCGEFENFVTILTEDSQKIQYTVAERATLDGDKKPSEEICTLLDSRYELIRYKVNSKNEVSMIDTADDGGSLEKVEYKGKAKQFFYSVRSYALAEYRDEKGAYINGSPKYYVNGSTKVFYRGADSKDEKKLRAATAAEFVDSTEYAVVAGYDMDENCVCGAIVIDASDNQQEYVYRYNNLFYISRLIKTIDSDDEIVYTIKGVHVKDGKAAEEEYIIYPDRFPNVEKMQSGDIIQFVSNGAEMRAIRYVHSLKGSAPEGFLESEVYFSGKSAVVNVFGDTMYLVMGKSVDRHGNILEIEYTNGGEKETGLFNISNGSYVEYENGRYSINTERQIPAVCTGNQRVLLHIRKGGTTDVVFIKE